MSDMPFSLLIKPASADCNLDCAYCFYARRPGLNKGTEPRRMSDRVLQRLISSYMGTDQPQYGFSWQGGEPTLMGRDFFNRAVDLQIKHGKPGSRVSNSIQTNGLLIDKPLANLFAGFNFLVGVSLDGPEPIHDMYRKSRSGQGSYQDVMKGIACLQENDVAFNILTLVTPANVNRGRDVFRFLCDKGFFYQQYIECVQWDRSGRPGPFSIDGEEWGRFLCEIFDEWLKSDIYRVSVRLFDAILGLLVNGPAQLCTMGRECNHYLVVETNGDIYPCDFFVRDEFKIGNIVENDWGEFRQSPVFSRFSPQKSRWHSDCDHCRYNFLCAGDCLKNRGYSPSHPGSLSRLCRGWQIFFDHALPGLQEIAETIRKKRENDNGPIIGN